MATSQLVTRSTRHMRVFSQSHLVTSEHYEWAMRNAGEADEAGNGYLYSFICGSGNFSGHSMIRHETEATGPKFSGHADI